MSHDLKCKHCGEPTPAGTCRCPGAVWAFVANLTDVLDEPLPCGHDLMNWCDYCETCGECRDEGKSNGGVVATLRARVAELEEERSANQCDGCRRGLPKVNGVHHGGGTDMIGCTAHLYRLTPAEREVIEAACEYGAEDMGRYASPRLGRAVAEIARLTAEVERLTTDLVVEREEPRELLAQLDQARAHYEHKHVVRIDADTECEKLRADLAATQAALLKAIPHGQGAGDDTGSVPVVRIAETVVRELAEARKVVEAALSALTAYGVHDPAEKIKRAVACLRGEKPEGR